MENFVNFSFSNKNNFFYLALVFCLIDLAKELNEKFYLDSRDEETAYCGCGRPLLGFNFLLAHVRILVGLR